MGSRTAMGAGKGLKGLGMALALVLGRSAAPMRSISGRQGASPTRMPMVIAKNLADGAAPRAAVGRGSGRRPARRRAPESGRRRPQA